MQFWGVKNVSKFVVLAVCAETNRDVMDFGGDQIRNDPGFHRLMQDIESER